MTASAHIETDPLCSWLMLHWTRSICVQACGRCPQSNTVRSCLCYATKRQDRDLHCTILVYECKACTIILCCKSHVLSIHCCQMLTSASSGIAPATILHATCDIEAVLCYCIQRTCDRARPEVLQTVRSCSVLYARHPHQCQ